MSTQAQARAGLRESVSILWRCIKESHEETAEQEIEHIIAYARQLERARRPGR
jgi:hypothetical protein